MNFKIIPLCLFTSLCMVGCGGGDAGSTTGAKGTGGSGSSITRKGNFYYSVFNYTDSIKKFRIVENEKWGDAFRIVWGNILSEGQVLKDSLQANANPQKPSTLEGMVDFEMLNDQDTPVDHKNGFIGELGPDHSYAYFMTKTITQGTQLPASYEQVDVFPYAKKDIKGKVPVISYLRDGDIILNRQCTDSYQSSSISQLDIKRGDSFSFSCPEGSELSGGSITYRVSGENDFQTTSFDLNLISAVNTFKYPALVLHNQPAKGTDYKIEIAELDN
ncbi:hypothetical protein [Veronia pacifica]|uniref:Uncharacterized protein n=1 Tax=Veronia pacifica TaxID=1080227 RepID=A0A1C3ESM3_9GAMM|nr:hypothetical protein [Veronia pacifica]ODA36260.1 hypothetical protein A8L45_01280 [Veronia pacifica]